MTKLLPGAFADANCDGIVTVGSIANIIVVDQAARLGVKISRGDHARVGVPTTLVTLVLSAAWLAWRAAMT